MARHINEEDIDLNNFNEVHECEHVFHDGNSCMNVAGPQQHFCRWHRTAAEREERRISYASRRRNKDQIEDLEIPTIEDPESLQIAIHEVMDAIIDGRLKNHQAGHLLYGLQLSLSNVKRRLHFPRTKYSVFNLINDLEEAFEERKLEKQAAQERRALKKKPPQSVKLTDLKEDSITGD
jgi:hypothetical protein